MSNDEELGDGGCLKGVFIPCSPLHRLISSVAASWSEMRSMLQGENEGGAMSVKTVRPGDVVVHFEPNARWRNACREGKV